MLSIRSTFPGKYPWTRGINLAPDAAALRRCEISVETMYTVKAARMVAAKRATDPATDRDIPAEAKSLARGRSRPTTGITAETIKRPM